MILLCDQHDDHAYHSSPGVTFHRLMDFVNRGPAYFYAKHIERTFPEQEERAWQRLGRAYHIYALEGEEAFNNKVVRAPATYPAPESAKKDAPIIQKPWNNNANYCKEWNDKMEKEGFIVLSDDEYDNAVYIGMNMRANAHAAKLLKCGWQEMTISQTEPRFNVPIKGRIDWLSSTSTNMTDAFAIVDPKGTVSIESFDRDAIKLGYYRQMAWYRKLVRDELGISLPCYLIAVEKDGMNRVRPYQVDAALLDIGEERNNRDLDSLAEHFQGKPWTLDHSNHLRSLLAPEWMTKHEPSPWE